MEGAESFLANEAKVDAFPVYFGISCSLAACRLLSPAAGGSGIDQAKMILQSSAAVMAALVSRGGERGDDGLRDRIRKQEIELAELRWRRREDARANEKVVAIFAAREQDWILERKRFRVQLQAAVAELRAQCSKSADAIDELKRRLEEERRAIGFKDEALEQELKRSKELEEKLSSAEQIAVGLRDAAEKAAEEHIAELWKHKTAFLQVVSSQRQLERKAEAAKQELEEAVAIAREMAAEIGRMQQDVEQKDKILSAMARKAKTDAEQQHVLLAEAKMHKAKRKQAEQEADRWKKKWELRHRKCCREPSSPVEIVGGGETAVQCIDRCQDRASDTPEVDGYAQLRDLIQKEAKKCAAIMEQRHNLELGAFSEQMRLKDERIECYRWRLMSADLESKHLQCRVDELDRAVSRFRKHTSKLEGMLLDKGREVMALKQQLELQFQPSEKIDADADVGNAEDPMTSAQEFEVVFSEETTLGKETDVSSAEASGKGGDFSGSKNEVSTTTWSERWPEDATACSEETEEEKEVPVDPGTVLEILPACDQKHSGRKMDVQALGVSFKIKRLKQQLQVLEKLAGSQNALDFSYSSAASFLHKHLRRYQSLEEKVDNLGRRTDEIYRGAGGSGRRGEERREEIDALSKFLEEAFQLQRYIVATGQKLLEIQGRITSSFSSTDSCMPGLSGFNGEQFGEIVRGLFGEVQRGLEIRITRIIGELEGTLASDGILRR